MESLEGLLRGKSLLMREPQISMCPLPPKAPKVSYLGIVLSCTHPGLKSIYVSMKLSHEHYMAAIAVPSTLASEDSNIGPMA